jgi:hypothetical protein
VTRYRATELCPPDLIQVWDGHGFWYRTHDGRPAGFTLTHEQLLERGWIEEIPVVWPEPRTFT